ncbi:hypothetical protein D3C76_1455620 [compost metagenome]
MYSYKVCQIEAAFRRTNEQRTTLGKPGNVLARIVAEAQQSAPVSVCFQRFVEQDAE